MYSIFMSNLNTYDLMNLRHNVYKTVLADLMTTGIKYGIK